TSPRPSSCARWSCNAGSMASRWPWPGLNRCARRMRSSASSSTMSCRETTCFTASRKPSARFARAAHEARSSRPPRPDRLELRLLFVAQRRIKVVKGIAHDLDRLLHGIEPPVDRIQARGCRSRIFRPAFVIEDIDRPDAGVLQLLESGTLSLVGMQRLFDLLGRPLQRSLLRSPAECGGRFRGLVRAGKRVEPCFLSVIEQVIEFL